MQEQPNSPGARVRLAGRKLESPTPATIERADVTLSALLPVYGALAWLSPERHWQALIRKYFVSIDEKGPLDTIVRGIEASRLQSQLPMKAGTAASELNANRLESYLQYLKDYAPGGWRPAAKIDNESALRQRSSEGKGVVLWIAHFVFNGLPLKKAIHDAEYQVFHLSRPEHGFSTTRFGMRFLNPIRSRIESRYLAKRIIIERGAEHRAVREAHRLLSAGKIVSITAGHWEGRQLGYAPIGHALLPLSVGAPSLARATGAALFPVFIVRETSGPFRIIIGEQIPCDPNLDRDDVVRNAIAQFAAQLLPYAVGYPDQWRGWKYLKPSDSGR